MEKDLKAQESASTASSEEQKSKINEQQQQVQQFIVIPLHQDEQCIIKEQLFKETIINEDKLNLVVKDVIFSRAMSQFISLLNIEYLRKQQQMMLPQQIEQNLQLYPYNHYDKQKQIKTQYFIHQQSKQIMLPKYYKSNTMFVRQKEFYTNLKQELKAYILETIAFNTIKKIIYYPLVLCSLEQLIQAKVFAKQKWTESELFFILNSAIKACIQLSKNKYYCSDWKPQNLVYALDKDQNTIKLKIYGFDAASTSGFEEFNGFSKLYAPQSAQQEFFDGQQKFTSEQQRISFEIYQIGRTIIKTALPSLCNNLEAFAGLFHNFDMQNNCLELLKQNYSEQFCSFLTKLLSPFTEKGFNSVEDLDKDLNELQKNYKLTEELTAKHYQPILEPMFASVMKRDFEKLELKIVIKEVLACIKYGIASLMQDMMVTCIDRLTYGFSKRIHREKEQCKKIILGCHSFFEKYKQLFVFISELEKDLGFQNFTADQQYQINYYIGNCFNERQRYNDAIKFYTIAYDIKKKENKFSQDCQELVIELSKVHVIMRNIEQAQKIIEEFQTAYRDSSRCPFFNAYLGQIYMLAQASSQAYDNLNMAKNFLKLRVEQNQEKGIQEPFLELREIQIKRMLSESLMYQKKWNEAEQYIQEAITICQKLQHGEQVKNFILIALQMHLGLIHYLQKKNKEAEASFLSLVDMIKKNVREETSLLKSPYLTLGELYMHDKQPEKSEKAYKNGIEMHYKDKMLSDDVEIARCCYYLAKQLHLQLKYKEAEFFYTKALAIIDKYEDTEVRVGSNINLGIMYTRFADLNKAEKFLMNVNQYMKYNPEKCPNYNESLVILYTLKNDYKQANEYCLKALNMAETTYGKEHAYLIAIFYHLAFSYKKLGNEQEAKKYADKAYEYVTKFNYAYQQLQADNPDFYELVKTLQHYGFK